MATANFVIVYTAREGSSAIIDQLSLCQGVSVPLFEELDKFWVERFYGGRLHIPTELDTIYSRNDFPHEDDWGFKNFVSGKKRGESVDSVGFKWRPHGSPASVVSTLKAHNVACFFLYRRDFDELIASLTISNYDQAQKGGPAHGQFDFAKMSDEERAQEAKKISSRTIPLPSKIFWSTAIKRVVHALRLRLMRSYAAMRGLKVQVVYYEDFLAAPRPFIQHLLEQVGLDDAEARLPVVEGTMKKATRTPATDRVEGFGAASRNPLFRCLRAVYRALT